LSVSRVNLQGYSLTFTEIAGFATTAVLEELAELDEDPELGGDDEEEDEEDDEGGGLAAGAAFVDVLLAEEDDDSGGLEDEAGGADEDTPDVFDPPLEGVESFPPWFVSESTVSLHFFTSCTTSCPSGCCSGVRITSHVSDTVPNDLVNNIRV
jgi:hypothetical protein